MSLAEILTTYGEREQVEAWAYGTEGEPGLVERISSTPGFQGPSDLAAFYVEGFNLAVARLIAELGVPDDR